VLASGCRQRDHRQQRRCDGFIAAVVGGLLVVTGFADFANFGYSQLPFAWPADLDRLLVALTLGGGIGLAFGGWVAMRRNAGQPKR
jgi:hypothetical protein